MIRVTLFISFILSVTNLYGQNINKYLRKSWYAQAYDYNLLINNDLDSIYFTSTPNEDKGIGGEVDYITWKYSKRKLYHLIILRSRRSGLSQPVIYENCKWVLCKSGADWYLNISVSNHKSYYYKIVPYYSNDRLNKILFIKAD